MPGRGRGRRRRRGNARRSSTFQQIEASYSWLVLAGASKGETFAELFTTGTETVPEFTPSREFRPSHLYLDACARNAPAFFVVTIFDKDAKALKTYGPFLVGSYTRRFSFRWPISADWWPNNQLGTAIFSVVNYCESTEPDRKGDLYVSGKMYFHLSDQYDKGGCPTVKIAYPPSPSTSFCEG